MKNVILTMVLLVVSLSASAQEVYASAKTGAGGSITLYTDADNCPGNSRLAILKDKFGRVLPGCWINGEEEYTVKWEDEWNNPYIYSTKAFNKNQYYVQLEKRQTEERAKKLAEIREQARLRSLPAGEARRMAWEKEEAERQSKK